MTPLKPLFFKGFYYVDKKTILLLYQGFKYLFLKKHLSDYMKNQNMVNYTLKVICEVFFIFVNIKRLIYQGFEEVNFS